MPSQTSAIRSAASGAITFAPITSTVASLLARAISARKVSWHSAARIPRILLQAICSPLPLPPSTIPVSAAPSSTWRHRSSHSTG